eukprot:XP_011616032.1 PREDICTED: chromodomain Y-like protein [Takifugu rubripes]
MATEELYEVEKILDKRKNKKGKLEYLVRWRGYGSEGDTWEPEGNLSTCMIYVHDFNRQHAEHQRENLLLRSTRRSPGHQALRPPCTLLLASTAGADVRGSEQVEPAMGLAQPGLTTPTGPAALSGQQAADRVPCSLMPTPPGGSARRSMDLSKMGIKILVPRSPMNSRPDSEESPSEARVQEAHLLPPEVALPEKPAGVQLGPGEERARMGSRPRLPHPSPSPAATAAATDRGAFDKRLRFSVRQTESAYRYRDIVVKKQDGFTHILLSTKSSENNTLNPEVMKEIQGAMATAASDDSKLVLLSAVGSVFCCGLDFLYFIRRLTDDRKKESIKMSESIR